MADPDAEGEAEPGDTNIGKGASRKKGKGKPGPKERRAARTPKATRNLLNLDSEAGEEEDGLLA